MALQRTHQLDLAAASTNRLGLAVEKAVHLGFVEHGQAVPLTSGLRAAFATTGAALRWMMRLPGTFEDSQARRNDQRSQCERTAPFTARTQPVSMLGSAPQQLYQSIEICWLKA